MQRHHPENERVKRVYLDRLREAEGYSERTIDGVARALARFEAYTGYKDFRTFRPEQAKGFKAHLRQPRPSTGKMPSVSTMYAALAPLSAFFKWLSERTGYRRLTYSDADYFNLTDNEVRVARAKREAVFPSLLQIDRILELMPAETDIERRDRALIALTILTGARDAALASARVKHINLAEGTFFQDAREVNTKRRKTFTSWFFPVGERPLTILREWVAFLRTERLWGDDDPLFPRTKVARAAEGEFASAGLTRTFWTNAQPIRVVFRAAFEAAGLPYFNPHSFRNTLAQLGEKVCRTPEEMKAWSQNLGHEKVLTTLTSYGTVAPIRQAELIRALGEDRPRLDDDAEAQLMRLLARIKEKT